MSSSMHCSKYHKAIGLYELALASFEKKLGVDHPYTKDVIGKLKSARAELEKQK